MVSYNTPRPGSGAVRIGCGRTGGGKLQGNEIFVYSLYFISSLIEIYIKKTDSAIKKVLRA